MLTFQQNVESGLSRLYCDTAGNLISCENSVINFFFFHLFRVTNAYNITQVLGKKKKISWGKNIETKNRFVDYVGRMVERNEIT